MNREPLYPTIQDVARLAKVSPATVSRVLNRSAPVRPALRQKVERAISQLNYHSSHAATALSRSRAHTLGLLIQEELAMLFSSHFIFSQIIQGAASVAREQGYSLLLHHCPPDSSYLTPWHRRQVDGLLLTATRLADPRVVEILSAGCPFVLTGGHRMGHLMPTVSPDNFAGALSAVEYLVSLGHRHIGYVGGWLEYSAGEQRLAGFQEGLARHGLSPARVVTLEGTEITGEKAQRALGELLTGSVGGVITTNDVVALALMQQAQQAGLRVPEDLSIIGFDDVEPSHYARPALTTLRLPGVKLGECAGRLLIDLIEGRQTAEPVPHISLPVEMILRESCGPPPQEVRRA